MAMTIESRARSVTPGDAVRRRVAVAALAALLLTLSLALPAGAATINYGSFSGTNVTFQNVSEASATDAVPLLGAPVLSGNTLDFNPLSFTATRTDAGSDITGGNLGFVIQAGALTGIDTISIAESGNVTLIGNVAPGSMGTAAAVFASGVIDIHEVDFVGINHLSIPFALTFNPSGGTYFLGTDGGGGPVFNTQWSGSVSLDIDAILTANGIVSGTGATKVSVNLTNTLAAVSQAGTSAVINKNDLGVVVVPHLTGPGFRSLTDGESREARVPEPGTLALLAAGVIALAIHRRRP